MRVLCRSFVKSSLSRFHADNQAPATAAAAGTAAPRNGPRRGAFGLVELLVCIGVIAVLLGLLLPTLAGARESANRTKCLSNLRQLGLAFTAYLNDNKGRFPRPAQNAVQAREDWVHFQSWRDPGEGAIAKYVGQPFNPSIYRCPTDDPASHRKFMLDSLTIQYPYSYTVNEMICRIEWRGPPLRINQVRNASEKILLIDEAATTIDDGCWAWQSQGGGNGTTDPRNVLSNRHDRRTERAAQSKFGRGNAAFVDGHVAFIGRGESFDARYFDPAR
jgi:prepilin-type processing-associated H-X9-DG protein